MALLTDKSTSRGFMCWKLSSFSDGVENKHENGTFPKYHSKCHILIWLLSILLFDQFSIQWGYKSFWHMTFKWKWIGWILINEKWSPRALCGIHFVEIFWFLWLWHMAFKVSWKGGFQDYYEYQKVPCEEMCIYTEKKYVHMNTKKYHVRRFSIQDPK